MITLILLLISFAAAPIFILLLRKYSLKIVIAFITALIVVSILAPFYLVYTYNFFGLGNILSCLAPLATIVSLSVVLSLYPRFSRIFEEAPLRRRIYLVGGLLVASLQCSPFAGVYLINASCDAINQVLSEEMIAALEAYRQAQGHYPENLEALVPAYLARLPSPACSTLYGDRQIPKFELEQCLTEEHLITIDSVYGGRIQRYNLGAGNWSSVSFLDGVCSFLK